MPLMVDHPEGRTLATRSLGTRSVASKRGSLRWRLSRNRTPAPKSAIVLNVPASRRQVYAMLLMKKPRCGARPRTENKTPPVVTDGANSCCTLKLEFVAQSELQDAGIGRASDFPVV
jgi:hypothetical protein